MLHFNGDLRNYSHKPMTQSHRHTRPLIKECSTPTFFCHPQPENDASSIDKPLQSCKDALLSDKKDTAPDTRCV
jgi:hypothetical protein